MKSIVSENTRHMKYEIREIVEIASNLAGDGMKITWENIGDPVKKGERLPEWIKEIVARLSLSNESYAYSDSQGGRAVREYLAQCVNNRGGCKLTANDFIFFNGLGDAIAKIFGYIDPHSRILGPSPAYSAISSIEAAHAGSPHLTYNRDPSNNWLPDPDEIEYIVTQSDSIVGIALINPDNPTGAVYPREILSRLVRIARKHGCFIVADETYARITYNGSTMVHLSDVIEDVPGLALRSISKEYPWPGARCGWVEIYNRHTNPSFARYIESLIALKRLEVCSTTLPQLSIPFVYSDPRFEVHCGNRNRVFEERSIEAYEALSEVEGISVAIPRGAFYLTVLFNEGVLGPESRLELEDEKIARYIEKKITDVACDKRFVYYLLAKTGICVVPLTGFCSKLPGFRMTLLETDDVKRRWIYKTIGNSIKEYLGS